MGVPRIQWGLIGKEGGGSVIVNMPSPSSLVPRPRPAFRRLQYGKAVEGLEYFIT